MLLTQLKRLILDFRSISLAESIHTGTDVL